MLVYKKWLLTFLKSFGQEIKKKEEEVKTELRHSLIKKGLITHSTNTPKNTEKIPSQNPML